MTERVDVENYLNTCSRRELAELLRFVADRIEREHSKLAALGARISAEGLGGPTTGPMAHS